MTEGEGVAAFAAGASQLIRPPHRHLRLYRCRGEARRPDDCEIIFGQRAYQRVVSHLAADTTREHGGLLLGYVIHSADGTPPTVVITGSLPAQATEGTPVSLTFTEETWLILQRETDTLEKLGGPTRRIGWYHSHPNLGIFLSRWDIDVCTNFGRPDHVALVVDPVQDLGGFFVNGTEGYRARTPQGFWELPDARAGSVVTWKNMRRVGAEELMPMFVLRPEPPAEEVTAREVEQVSKSAAAESGDAATPVAEDALSERPPDEQSPPEETGVEVAPSTNESEAAPPVDESSASPEGDVSHPAPSGDPGAADVSPADDERTTRVAHGDEAHKGLRLYIPNFVKHPVDSVWGILSRGDGTRPGESGAKVAQGQGNVPAGERGPRSPAAVQTGTGPRQAESAAAGEASQGVGEANRPQGSPGESQH